MSRATAYMVRMPGEVAISEYHHWHVPTIINTQETEEEEEEEGGNEEDYQYEDYDGGDEGAIEIGSSEEDASQENWYAGYAETIVPTKPKEPIPTAPKRGKGRSENQTLWKSPWLADLKKPIGAPRDGPPIKGGKHGSTGHKKNPEIHPMEKPAGRIPIPPKKREREEEKEWEWYPQPNPGNKAGKQTGTLEIPQDKRSKKGKGKGKEGKYKIPQDPEETEDEERYGHVLQNGRRVPWDLLLDREIKVEVTPKPPPPKLSEVQKEAARKGKGKGKQVPQPRVKMTEEEIDKILRMMEEEDKGMQEAFDKCRSMGG